MKTTFKREAIIGNQGFVINGGKTGGGSGYSVSSAGDVNGDGLDDLRLNNYWNRQPYCH
jgi:hypothetical protein